MRLRPVEDAPQFVPVGDLFERQRLHRRAARDARVVHKDVDRPDFFFCKSNGCIYAFSAGHIQANHMRIPALGFDVSAQ